MAARRLAAGELDQRVTPLVPTTTEDAAGQQIEEFVEQPAVWAKVQPLRGREWFAAEAAQSSAQVRITVRFRPGVTGAWRWRWNGVDYTTLGEPINVDGANQAIEIMAAGGRQAAEVAVPTLLALDFSDAANSQYLMRSVGGI